MMQLLCNGVFLDMPDSVSLAFKRTNVLFAFDKIACERTLSFDIPATPKNEQVFGLAKLPENGGNGMRVKFPCQLQAGPVTLDGVLHVESYSGTYKGVFVTGDLVGLQVIRDAGKIADLLAGNTLTTIWSALPGTPAQGKNSDWSQIDYKTQAAAAFPSVRLSTIITQALQSIGKTWTCPAGFEYVRFIPAELSGIKSTGIVFAATARPMSESAPYVTAYTMDAGALAYMFGADSALVSRTVGIPATTILHGYVSQMEAKQPVQISFPEDWDDNMFVGYFVNGGSNSVAEFSFYGERAFDENGNVTGESLRGRTIDVPRGGKLAVIDKAFYLNRSTSGGQEVGLGFDPLSEQDATIEGGEMDLGSLVRMIDNLPDATIVGLLKVAAALTGKVLNYTEAGGIAFDDLQAGTWNVTNMQDKLIAIDEVKRTFGDYARRNLVQYDSAENVPDVERIVSEYVINNDNLAAVQDLQIVPFSEGTSAGAYGDETMLAANEADTLGDADTAAAKMIRTHLPLNAGLQTLCTKSTTIVARFRLSFLEYNQITSHTLLQVGGVRYVWTDAQWQKDVAKFTLSAV